MAVYGADVHQLLELSTLFGRVAESLNASVSAISQALANAAWTGPKAVDFRNEWSSSARSVSATASGLFEQAQSLKRHALEQEYVSQGGGLLGAVRGLQDLTWGTGSDSDTRPKAHDTDLPTTTSPAAKSETNPDTAIAKGTPEQWEKAKNLFQDHLRKQDDRTLAEHVTKLYEMTRMPGATENETKLSHWADEEYTRRIGQPPIHPYMPDLRQTDQPRLEHPKPGAVTYDPAAARQELRDEMDIRTGNSLGAIIYGLTKDKNLAKMAGGIFDAFGSLGPTSNHAYKGMEGGEGNIRSGEP